MTKIVVNNALIESQTNMSLCSLKSFEYILSQLSVLEPSNTKQIILRVNELFNVIGKKSHQRNVILKNTIDELNNSAHICLINSDCSKKIVIKPISDIKWIGKDGEIKVVFSDEILPYITNLERDFTQYSYEIIDLLNSKYSIMIYKELIKPFNLYRNYKIENKGAMQYLKKYKNPKRSVKKLRAITNTENKYTRFSSFKNNVLNKAIKEINQKTNLFVDYKVIYSNRYVTDIQFNLSENNKNIIENKSLSFSQIEDQKQIQFEENQVIVDVLKSKYLKKLVNKKLLKANDFIGINTLKGLSIKVFPLYEKIEKSLGERELNKHLRYVNEHKYNNYKNSNISEYLHVAAKQFIEKFNIK